MRALVIRASSDRYGPCAVYLGEALIGYRPYDGSCRENIEAGAEQALAAMLRERLGWSETDPDEDPS